MNSPVIAAWRSDQHTTISSEQQSNDTLLTQAQVHSFHLGSGDDIYSSVLPELIDAEQEVILVTCFWALSSTQQQLCDALKRLSEKAIDIGRTIRVRICFSSLSLIQKLFHTRSPSGHIYSQSQWQRRFGLPAQHEISGLDLQIKSIFVLPFSVMHPKYIIIDRKRVFLPSCNVSWENWLEGCVEISGPIVEHLIQHWRSFWASPQDCDSVLAPQPSDRPVSGPIIQAAFLPSQYHALDLFDFPGRPASPATALNTFIISVLGHAQHSIYVQTPNLTSQVVLDGIISALKRGIDIRIVTSERLMIMEQLLTARTTTSRCVKWLLSKYARMTRSRGMISNTDMETGASQTVGKLEVLYYNSRDRDGYDQTHLKLTIVDDEIVVLGSGNMDRASWVTSQELGVAFVDANFAARVSTSVTTKLQNNLLQAI